MKKLVVSLLVFVVIICIGFYIVFHHGKVNPGRFSTQEVTAVRNVAVHFFQASSAGEWSKAKTYCPYIDRLKSSLKFEGLEVINIGEPYTRFWYPGMFVPYKIKFKSGETKKFSLAVRNDNSLKVWQIDGGL